MSEPTTKYGILVAVDGSAESDAAVRWATREAVMRDAPLTLAHVVTPVVVSWPVASLQGSFNEWQEENAQHVIEQAQKTLHASLGEARSPRGAHRGAALLHRARAGRRVQRGADGRRRQPGHGCDRSDTAGFGQQRFGPPCAWPGRGCPRRRSPGT